MPIPPSISDVLPQQWAALLDAYEKLGPSDRYLYWDELAGQEAPAGVSAEVWWAALKLSRSPRTHCLPFRDHQGRSFRFCVPDLLLARLHHLDRLPDAPGIGADEIRRLAAKALVREAIGSARLAGAEIRDEAARELLRLGRPPEGDSERIVANLHRALELTGEWRGRDLRPGDLSELHRTLLAGLPTTPVVADPAGPGHPPDADLAGRLEPICALANGEIPKEFIHPFVRAAVLSFLIAHERLFADGNGRLARLVFRWALLRRGYSRFDLLAPSAALAVAPAACAESLARADDDDGDATYSILHQADAVQAAEQTLQDDLRRAREQLRRAGASVPALAELNPRQQALLAHALRHPGAVYVIAGHQRSHGVTHQTARCDLFSLVRRGLLAASREGRTYRFRAGPRLMD